MMHVHTVPFERHLLLGLLAGLLLAVLSGCASSQPYVLGPIKTVDPDDHPIPEPEEVEQNQYWDRVDLTVFYQLEKPLNLNWTGRQAGRLVGVSGAQQADNVNVLDEPPESSWYTRRHYYQHMTREALARGPNDLDTTGVTAGPDTSGTWTITRGKSVGAASGFFIRDLHGDRYLIKLDKPAYPELASSAEVISTKIFYAAGYNVPQNTITYFHPDQLTIGEGATVQENGKRRPMQPEDVKAILANQPRTSGKIRAMASKFVAGTPLGPWDFRGTRGDDPNDRVWHEHRRELRGLRVIGSWLNDTDRRAANTLAVYTDERYIKHYLIDMSSTLGANTGSPHQPIHGQAYMIDPRYMAQAWLSLGTFRFPWWEYEHTILYPSVGYFRADVFKPGKWVPTYPNPAFEKMTLRDAFWGAKIVMSFRDADLKAIAETAQMTNPEAEAYLLDVLKKRRDRVGRYWFARINPLDRFRIETVEGREIAVRGSTSGGPPRRVLRFDDLAVTSNLASADSTSYVYSIYHSGTELVRHRTASESTIPLVVQGERVEDMLARRGATDDDERVVRVDIRTQRTGKELSERVRVYVSYPARGASPRVAGIQRDG